MKRVRASGFTLIELLIVVAIIAILAAIAVPNFLEAQTRAKVSRARADMRTVATGLEAYYTDANTYPFQNPQYRALRINATQPLVLENLSTPIAYLTGIASFVDPFRPRRIYRGVNLDGPFQGPTIPPDSQMEVDAFRLYTYYARNDTRSAIGGRNPEQKPSWYAVGSAGPDGAVDNLNDPLTTGYPNDDPAARAFFINTTMYDPTNGTVSRGGLYRVGGSPAGAGRAFFNITAGR